MVIISTEATSNNAIKISHDDYNDYYGYYHTYKWMQKKAKSCYPVLHT